MKVQDIQRIKATFMGWVIDKREPLVPMPDCPIDVFINGYREYNGKITYSATIVTGQLLGKHKSVSPDKLKDKVKERFREQVSEWCEY